MSGLAALLGVVMAGPGPDPFTGPDGPLLVCSDPAYGRDRYHVTEVKDLLLRLAGLAD